VVGGGGGVGSLVSSLGVIRKIGGMLVVGFWVFFVFFFFYPGGVTGVSGFLFGFWGYVLWVQSGVFVGVLFCVVWVFKNQ